MFLIGLLMLLHAGLQGVQCVEFYTEKRESYWGLLFSAAVGTEYNDILSFIDNVTTAVVRCLCAGRD